MSYTYLNMVLKLVKYSLIRLLYNYLTSHMHRPPGLIGDEVQWLAVEIQVPGGVVD